MSFTVITVWHW